MTDYEKLVELLDNFDRNLSPFAGNEKFILRDDHVELAKYLIENDIIKRVHATWTLNATGTGTCSNCHFTQSNVWDYDNYQQYCGVCGAKMDGEVNDH
jgi:hypothetical protein